MCAKINDGSKIARRRRKEKVVLNLLSVSTIYHSTNIVPKVKHQSYTTLAIYLTVLLDRMNTQLARSLISVE